MPVVMVRSPSKISRGLPTLHDSRRAELFSGIAMVLLFGLEHTLPLKQLRRRQANTAVAAGNDGGLTVQLFHGDLPLSVGFLRRGSTCGPSRPAAFTWYCSTACAIRNS